MPHLAVVAFNLVTIILVLMFVRFRWVSRLSRTVYFVLDALIILLLLGLAFVCLQFAV